MPTPLGKQTTRHITANVIFAQNTSGGAIAPNATVAGTGLTPAQTGTWLSINGASVANLGYGQWMRA